MRVRPKYQLHIRFTTFLQHEFEDLSRTKGDFGSQAMQWDEILQVMPKYIRVTGIKPRNFP